MTNPTDYTTKQIETVYGMVTVTTGFDVLDFESQEAKIIGKDSADDGPYFEEVDGISEAQWEALNEACHAIMRKDFYEVGMEYNLDGAPADDDPEGWVAWVTNDPTELYRAMRDEIRGEIFHAVNRFDGENSEKLYGNAEAINNTANAVLEKILSGEADADDLIDLIEEELA